MRSAPFPTRGSFSPETGKRQRSVQASLGYRPADPSQKKVSWGTGVLGADPGAHPVLPGRQTRSCSVERGLSLSSYLLGSYHLNIKFLIFFVLSPGDLRGGSGVKKSLLFPQRARDLFPDPHISWLTTACNSNSRVVCSGLLRHLYMPGIHWHKHQLIKKNFF